MKFEEINIVPIGNKKGYIDIILLPQGGGKTRRLIEKSASNVGMFIVCFSRAEAQRVALLAYHMVVTIPHPITYQEFVGDRLHLPPYIKGLLIDDVECFITWFAGRVPIVAITMTVDNV